MPTINSRLYLVQKREKKRPLTIEEKCLLGREIVTAYYSQDQIKAPLQKTLSREPEGDFLVLSYPQLFVTEIDRIITEFISPFPPAKKRKRKPTKKEFSAKPTQIS